MDPIKQIAPAERKIWRAGTLTYTAGALGMLYFLLILAEDEEEIKRGGECGNLDNPEHTHLAVHYEEIYERHPRFAAEHNGCRVADERSRALQIGGNGYGDYAGDGRDFQLFGKAERNRRDHKHGGDVVHKRGHQPREQRERYYRPFYVGHTRNEQVGKQGGHFRLYEQGDYAHSARDNHKDVPVYRRGKIPPGQNADAHKQKAHKRGDVSAPFREREQKHICDQKQY